jgi:hypothetical protein
MCHIMCTLACLGTAFSDRDWKWSVNSDDGLWDFCSVWCSSFVVVVRPLSLGRLKLMQVDAEVIGSRRCITYIGRLQGFWTTRVVEREEGVEFTPNRLESIVRFAINSPFQGRKWLCT